MMRKICLSLCVLSLFLGYIHPAQADKEFIQKVQAIIGKVQEKAKTAQEAIQANLDEIKKLREEAENMKEMATEDLAEFNKALDEAQNMNLDALKELKQVAKGLEEVGQQDPEESLKTVENVYASKSGSGSDSERHKQEQDFIQGVMKKAVTGLYALGFTTRTTMQKETPRDPDMSSSDKIAREIGLKSGEIIERLSTIYTLESQMQNYQYTQAMRVMTVDASAAKEEEK